MAEKPRTKQNGTGINEVIVLLDKAFDGLMARSLREEAFSEDLTESIVPTINALRTAKTTYINHLREHVKVSGAEGLAAIGEYVKSIGAADMLNAAIAAGKIPAEGVATKSLNLKTGEKVKPWLHIIKEIIELLLNYLPIPIPGWLKDAIKELLNIIDKIFGGKIHDS